MLAIVLALGTSVTYGLSNFLGPRLAERLPTSGVLVVGQGAALAGAALLVLAVGEPAPPAGAVALGAVAGAGNALGLACFYRAASLGPVSIAAAIGATGTVVPVLFGLLGGEQLSTLQAVGVAAAIAGAVLASLRDPAREIPTDPRAAAWAALSAVGLGILLVALPRAAEDGTTWALLDARLVVVALLVAGVAALRLPGRVPAREVPKLTLPGLLLLAGTLMYAEAAARGQLSIVSVLASLATVVTVALAYLVVGERLSRVQRAGVALAVAGTVLLAA